jgi:hypothetical protein
VDSKSDKIKKGDKVLLFNARKSSRKGSKMEKSWKGPYDMKITIQAKRYPNHFGLRYRFLVSFAVSSDLNLSTRPFVWG